jgi:transcriptional regulator with XRE-family HTH domain
MAFQVLDDIRKARLMQDISIAEYSAHSGLSEPTLSKILSGKQEDAKLTTLTDMSAALGLEIRAVPEGSVDSVEAVKAIDTELFNRILVEKDHLAAQKDRIIQVQRHYVSVLFWLLIGSLAAFAAVLICLLS